MRFSTIEALDSFLDEIGLRTASMTRAALFLAGKVFQTYGARGGSRTGVLPDLLIGGHAAAVSAPLLTRDDRRYRRYFSKLELITPNRR